MFKNGEKVKTNKLYWDIYKREVYGTVVRSIFPMPYSEYACLVLWEKQRGKIIPEHQNEIVLMTTDSLEKVYH